MLLKRRFGIRGPGEPETLHFWQTPRRYQCCWSEQQGPRDECGQSWVVSQLCLLVGPFPGQPLCMCCFLCLQCPSPSCLLENSCSPLPFWLGQCLLPEFFTDPLLPQVDLGEMILSLCPDHTPLHPYSSVTVVCSSVTQQPGNSVKTTLSLLSLHLKPDRALLAARHDRAWELLQDLWKSWIPKNKIIGSKTRRETLQ